MCAKLKKFKTGKKISLYIMAGLYFIAGCWHFVHPLFYIAFMPSWLPAPLALIYISGFFEILFAVLLLFPSARKAGAIGIILVLIAVFPANIQHTINFFYRDHPLLWLSILRLPFQLVLIWWASLYIKP